MKLRIITSLLLIMFLSVGSSSVASAHDGCGGGSCYGWGHGGWGHGHRWGGNAYVYGPDGMYAHCRDSHKECCDKDKETKCADKCDHHDYCAPTMRRAYYHEDCCYGAYLSHEGHKSCCDKKEKDENKD